MTSKAHWENVYATKSAQSVSWYQEHADCSLRLIREAGADKDARIIDIGGGASVFVDDLLTEGYRHVSVLDISGAALAAARQRLGDKAAAVIWIESDITQAALPRRTYDVWHDRAVFHFLTDPADRAAYVRQVLHSVKPGGLVIVASFAEDGPTQCSGLPVVRYSPEGLHGEFGDAFLLLGHEAEAHRTPSGAMQSFVYCFCRRGDVS